MRENRGLDKGSWLVVRNDSEIVGRVWARVKAFVVFI